MSEGERTIPACLALVTGPTPGHAYPALAVADAVRTESAAARVVFLAPADADVNHLIEDRGFACHTIPASPLVRTGLSGRVRAGVQLRRGVAAARRVLAHTGAQMVIGFGSYASGPAVLAARTLGLRTGVHEANAIPGVANRLLGRLVDDVYLAIEPARPWWRRSAHVSLVGTPVRAEIAALATAERRFPADRPVRVLVLGGTWGAGFLAREVPALLSATSRTGVSLEVRHQASAEFVEPARAAYEELRLQARVQPYIDDMADAYGWADFVIARSGAGVISEVAIAALPSLLVPWAEASGDHQSHNAMAFTRGGGGLWIREGDWAVDQLAERIATLVTDRAAWERASRAARSMARPEAAILLARDALACIDPFR